MSAGLDASTVTPGSTAPEVSLTNPLIEACADASVGIRRAANAAIKSRARERMEYTPVMELMFARSLRHEREKPARVVVHDPVQHILGRAGGLQFREKHRHCLRVAA